VILINGLRVFWITPSLCGQFLFTTERSETIRLPGICHEKDDTGYSYGEACKLSRLSNEGRKMIFVSFLRRQF